MNTEALPCPYFDAGDGGVAAGGGDALLVRMAGMENVTRALRSDHVDDGAYLYTNETIDESSRAYHKSEKTCETVSYSISR